MKTQIKLILFIYMSALGCSSGNDNNHTVDTLAKKIDSSLLPKKETVENDCVFDTSMFKFTTNKLKEYKKDITYTWNNIAKEATVIFPDNDTLKLSIGGCDHFGYSATYLTDGTKFNDQPFLNEKAKWLAENFLGGGFDKTFANCISNKLYELDSSRKEIKSLTIANKDTSLTNKIYEPILFELQGGRTKISVVGYEN